MAMNGNSKLLYLPLRELQLYLTNLEIENEKLKTELTTFSRFNCILENIRRSSNKGFNSMQIIDRNKGCRCNDHINGHLRRVAQEADIELRVWQEQYDKLVLKTKQDYMASYDDDTRSVSLSPSSSVAVSPPLPEYRSLDSEPENISLSSTNTNDTNYSNHSNTTLNINSRNGSISLDAMTNDSVKSSFTFDDNNSKDKQNGINDEAVIQYISRSPSADGSTTSRSPPIVVYDSTKDKRLVCDWPNCDRIFINEEILIHHRRNHIRKSIYHCEFCSTRLLSKQELDNHMKTHTIPKNDESDKDLEPLVVVEEDEEDMRIDVESTEAVNLSNNKRNNTLNSSVNDINYKKTVKNALTFQTALLERLSANQKSSVNNTNANPLADNPKVNQTARADEYKRTRYSGVGRYRCPWPDCGYTPHFLRDLRRHMYKHTGDKKHKCDFPGCDFVSVWKTSLLQHQRKKHFIDNNHINTNDSLFKTQNL